MIAVDIGNTKTSIGFFRDGVLTHKWKVATDARQTKDQYRLFVEQFLASFGEHFRSAGSMMISCVVPSISQKWSGLKKDIDLYFVTQKTPTSFQISIPEPDTLGSDRIADAEAAVRKYGVPAIVIDAGTALTISVVDSEKKFIGGAIAPGIGISLKALFASAARLTQFELGMPSKVIGSTTQEAIESGIHHGYAAMVNGIVERFEKQLGMANASVVATGGSSAWLAPSLRTGIQLEPDLTLTGLYHLHENLRNGKSSG